MILLEMPQPNSGVKILSRESSHCTRQSSKASQAATRPVPSICFDNKEGSAEADQVISLPLAFKVSSGANAELTASAERCPKTIGAA